MQHVRHFSNSVLIATIYQVSRTLFKFINPTPTLIELIYPEIHNEILRFFQKCCIRRTSSRNHIIKRNSRTLQFVTHQLHLILVLFLEIEVLQRTNGHQLLLVLPYSSSLEITTPTLPTPDRVLTPSSSCCKHLLLGSDLNFYQRAMWCTIEFQQYVGGFVL